MRARGGRSLGEGRLGTSRLLVGLGLVVLSETSVLATGQPPPLSSASLPSTMPAPAPASAPASGPASALALASVASPASSTFAQQIAALRRRYEGNDPAAIHLAIRAWLSLPRSSGLHGARSPARPSGEPEPSDALGFFAAGARRFDAGDWQGAVEDLGACHARVPEPDLLYFMAVAKDRGGAPEDAARGLYEFLQHASPDDPLVPSAKEALTWIEVERSPAIGASLAPGASGAGTASADPLGKDVFGFILQVDLGLALGVLDSRWSSVLAGGDARVELPLARAHGLWAYGDAAIDLGSRPKTTLDPVLGTHPALEYWSLGGGVSWRYRLGGWRELGLYFAPAAGASWGLFDYSPAAKGPAYARYENLTLDLDPAFLLVAGHVGLRLSALAVDVILDDHYDSAGSSWMNGDDGLRSGGVLLELLRVGVGGYF